jgi:tetratricopeptide (TPR) repeat protein
MRKNKAGEQTVNTKANFKHARVYYRKGKFSKALIYLRQANRAVPRNKSVLLSMADCYLKLGDYNNAIRTIKRTLKIDKRNDKLYFNLCIAYSRIGNIKSTIKAGERAIEINPNELNYYIQLVDVYVNTNEHDKALKIIRQGLKQFPDNGPLQIMTAKSERLLGKNKDSLNCLKNLSTQETSLAPDWKARYNFELGFVYDGNNSADLAFHHFTEANNIVRSLPSYQGVDVNNNLDRICNMEKLNFGKLNEIIEFSKRNPPPVQPVFFVGFPRSGTTLLQKILDSHQDIHVIEENNPLGRVAFLIEREPEKYLESSFLLNKNNIEKLRAMYFAEARKHVPIDDGSLLIDKFPMYIVNVPIIKILFPDAKILLGSRHPCDSVLSCFMQHFRVNRAWAIMFEFSSIINYYDKTMRLWKIFKNEIEFESYSIRYEDLVENMEGEVRSLLQFLDLSWDEGVLNYRQNAFKRGLIRNPSYGQVVKPIYKEARYRWHRYAKYFEPHFEKLEPHCEASGYSLEIGDQVGG